MEQGDFLIELYTRDERLKRDASIEGREEGREEENQKQQMEFAKRLLLRGEEVENVHELIPELCLEEIKNIYEEFKTKRTKI